MKKIALGLGAIFLFFMLAVSALIVAVFNQQAAQNTDGIVLENLVFEGEELNDKVTIEMSGDAEATLTGKMSEDRKSFTVSWEGEEGVGEITAGEASKVGQKAVEAAISHKGKVMYVQRKADLPKGVNNFDWKHLDCGRMVQFAYREAGIDIPQNTKELKKYGKNIGTDFSKAKVGDILVYHNGTDPYRHVALYAGNNKLVEVMSSGGGKLRVVKARKKKLDSIRRVVDSSSFNTDVIYSVLPQNKSKTIFDIVHAASMEKTAEKTWRSLKAVGCSDEAAAGIMGNIQQECSFNAAYDSGGDYGLFNMNQGRAEKMREYARKRGKSWTDPQMQVEWCDKKNASEQFKTYAGQDHNYTYDNGTKTWWRKKISWREFKGLNASNYTKYLDHGLDSATGNGKDNNAVELAAHIFCNVFERAGIPRMDNRRKYAAEWYKKFVGKFPTGGADGFEEMNFTGTIDGEKLTLTGNIDEHQIEAEGTFRKWSEEETHKNVKTHNEIYAEGGEEGNTGGVSTGELAWPVKGKGVIWRGWGVWTGTSGANHYHGGLDIEQAEGSPIYAADGGKVVAVTTPENGGSLGLCVTIKHDKYITRYQHLKSYSVKKGDTVSKGQQIAKMGHTFYASGSCGTHLHFEVWHVKVWDKGYRYANEYAPSWGCGKEFRGATIDPLQVLPKNNKMSDARGFKRKIGRYKGNGPYGTEAQGAENSKRWQ